MSRARMLRAGRTAARLRTVVGGSRARSTGATCSDGTTSITHAEPVVTTVRAARTDLPLLQADEDAFVSEITTTLPEKPANYEAVIAINAGRRRPSDEAEAASLELGPNNCAATGD